MSCLSPPLFTALLPFFCFPILSATILQLFYLPLLVLLSACSTTLSLSRWPMGFFFVAFPGAACFVISHICVDHGYTANFILNPKLEASLQSRLHKSQCLFELQCWVTMVEWSLMSLDSVRFSLKVKDLADPDYTPSVLTHVEGRSVAILTLYVNHCAAYHVIIIIAPPCLSIFIVSFLVRTPMTYYLWREFFVLQLISQPYPRTRGRG